MEAEEGGIVKDEKPYWIFRCNKCEQYMYVKPTQKRKKCLRCGRTHTVAKLDIVDEVKGMTTAVNRVKELQNMFVKDPMLSGKNEFSAASSQIIGKKASPQKNESNQQTQFYDLLHDLAENYPQFPYYMIELMAQERGIDSNEIQLLLRNLVKKGIIRQLDHNYYTLS